jgi:hypothetical protein
MSLTRQQLQTLIDSESLGTHGRQALQAELERLTQIRDGLPLAGDLGATPRNELNLVLFNIASRLAVPDPLPAADAPAVASRLEERRTKRATEAALRAELLTTTEGSSVQRAILEDIVEYTRATSDREG